MHYICVGWLYSSFITLFICKFGRRHRRHIEWARARAVWMKCITLNNIVITECYITLYLGSVKLLLSTVRLQHTQSSTSPHRCFANFFIHHKFPTDESGEWWKKNCYSNSGQCGGKIGMLAREQHQWSDNVPSDIWIHQLLIESK